MTTLIQFRRLTRSRLGVPVTDDFFDDATLDDAINLALAELAAEARWPWNEHSEVFPLAEGEKFIPVPSGTVMRSVFDGPREVKLVSPSDLQQWAEYNGGPPCVWTPQEDRIELRPNGATDITLSYYVDEPWLADDTDTPHLPSRYAGAVVAKAAQLLSARESDRGSEESNAVTYAGWVARMRKDMRSSTGPVVPRVRPGSWLNV